MAAIAETAVRNHDKISSLIMMYAKFGYATLVLLLAFTFAVHAKVIDLDEDNWRLVLDKEWMIEL